MSRPETLARCLIVAPGLLVAPVFLAPSSIVILMILGTSMTASSLVLLASDDAPNRSDGVARSRTSHHRDTLTATAVGGLAAVSLAGATSVSPVIGLLVLLAALLCSRTLRFGARRRWSPTRVVETPTAAEEAPAPVVPRQRSQNDRPVLDAAQLATLSDRDLCLAWRASYVVLERSRSPLERLCVVEWRRVCLDEMEARHPAALTAWLDSGARAAGGPDRFLPPGPPPAP